MSQKKVKDKTKLLHFVIDMMIKCTKIKNLNGRICEMLKVGI